MNTYLFLWNPKKWTWDTLENDTKKNAIPLHTIKILGGNEYFE